MLFWFSSVYTTLAIAVNRLLGISYPMSYTVWFSTRNTVKVIIVCWTLGVLHSVVYIFEGCDFFYSPSLYIWMFADTECGILVGMILDLGHGMFFMCLIFILNIITAMKLRRANQVPMRRGKTWAGGLETNLPLAPLFSLNHCVNTLFCLV
ncbi:MAG: hypothetical protein GY696_34420 [Gammaproteobacteria bacterium]|nr:hypothetical protein [Gammaproteobacteria bacterium]